MLMRQIRAADGAWSFDTLFALTREDGESEQQFEARRPVARQGWDAWLDSLDAANELPDGSLPR